MRQLNVNPFTFCVMWMKTGCLGKNKLPMIIFLKKNYFFTKVKFKHMQKDTLKPKALVTNITIEITTAYAT